VAVLLKYFHREQYKQGSTSLLLPYGTVLCEEVLPWNIHSEQYKKYCFRGFYTEQIYFEGNIFYIFFIVIVILSGGVDFVIEEKFL
jgi:hypothetical protein